MMKTLGLCAALVALTAAAPMPHDAVAGTWINPHGSVAVRTGACQGKLCGWIVWANAEAKADAKDAGVTQLVGTALLQDYVPAGNGSWQGNVLVPDMGRSFSSTIAAIGPSTLKVKGCLIGGFICRSQLWRRIETLPGA